MQRYLRLFLSICSLVQAGVTEGRRDGNSGPVSRDFLTEGVKNSEKEMQFRQEGRG